MKDLDMLVESCKSELLALNIPIGTIDRVTVNDRAKSRWGRCSTLPNGHFAISVSAMLLADDVSDIACKNTLLHEMLHTAPSCMSHTGKWKKYANLVNAAYGYDVKRATSYEEKGMEKPVVPVKHRFVCQGCGQVVERERESKFTKNYSRYKCATCGGDFTKMF